MVSVLGGLVAAVIGVLWLAVWGGWDEFLMVVQGSVPVMLILGGLVAIAAGISTMKENAALKKEAEEEKKEEEKKE